MRKPLMRNNYLRMSLQSRLYPARLPIPENNISLSITATNPFAIRGKSYLTCVSCDGMTGETLFAVLTEVVGAVDEDLIVEGLSGEVAICNGGREKEEGKREKEEKGVSRYKRDRRQQTYWKGEESLQASSACEVQRCT